MARWRLLQPHYLKTEDEIYEYKETNRDTGRQATKKYEVPRLFDPNNPADCDRNGECIVCHKGKGQRGDFVFFGPPTPDMEPLDDEAKKISAEWEKKWERPIESLPGDFSQSLISEFEKKMLEAAVKVVERKG